MINNSHEENPVNSGTPESGLQYSGVFIKNTNKKRLSIDELLALPELERKFIIEEQIKLIEQLDDVIEDS